MVNRKKDWEQLQSIILFKDWSISITTYDTRYYKLQFLLLTPRLKLILQFKLKSNRKSRKS